VKKRIAIGVVLLLLGVGGAVAGLWYREQTEDKTVRGSSSVEFETTSEPSEERRPANVVEEVPWPMYGYDPARTHVASDFEHRPPYRRLWSVETGDYLEFPPAVADGRLFAANQRGRIMAIGAKKGRVLWQKQFPRCIAAGAAVAYGLVFQPVMGTIPCHARSGRERMRGIFLAMDQKTGKVRWRFDRTVIESSPLVIGRLVIVGAWDHKVYAFDARTGKIRWTFDTGSEINSSAAYGDGLVFIGTNSGEIIALTAFTGRLRWRSSSFARFGRREFFYATPTVAYGRVYAANTDGTLYAFGAKTGNLLWAKEVGSYLYTAPAVWQRRVYVGSYDGRFSALDAATGDVVWRWEAPGAIHGAPTVLGGLVYFSSTSRGLATSKAQRYVKAGKRGTYALDARTGKVVWRRPGQGQYSPIVADEARVYLTGSTRIHGLKPIGPDAAPQVRLAIEVQLPDATRRFRLSCRPARGTVPDPRRACAALADHPEILRPPARRSTCDRPPGNPPEVRVRGRVESGRILIALRPCDTPDARRAAARRWLGLLGLRRR
jgi:outer membrane protein assembly factor BamB